jgi:hypothetical protein
MLTRADTPAAWFQIIWHMNFVQIISIFNPFVCIGSRLQGRSVFGGFWALPKYVTHELPELAVSWLPSCMALGNKRPPDRHGTPCSSIQFLVHEEMATYRLLRQSLRSRSAIVSVVVIAGIGTFYRRFVNFYPNGIRWVHRISKYLRWLLVHNNTPTRCQAGEP